jgi:2-aminoadipate transaminase
VVAPSSVALSQATVREGIVEFAVGQPDPTLLPAEALGEATRRALQRFGGDAIGYGAESGPGPLIDWLIEHLGRIDARAPSTSELMTTAGNSHALDLVANVFTRAGDVALVEIPTYHLALGILRDRGLELVGVATDGDGLRPDAVRDALSRSRAAGKRVSLLYTIPTFGNPTGRTMPIERRYEIAALAAEHGFVVAEDDVYRELSFGEPAPPSIGALDEGGWVLRMGSFSKSLAPGLRLGWLSGDARRIRAVLDSGLLISGGGLNPITALAVAEFAAAGAYEPNVAHLRETYRSRRDGLIGALREALPDATFDVPAGGYFVWLRLPRGLDSRELRAAAEAAGLTYVPGPAFDASDALDPSWLRLSFARYGSDDLALGARRLGTVVAARR